MPTPDTNSTDLLTGSSRSNDDAAQQLISLLYDELRGLARHLFKQQQVDNSLQPTALVHEAYLRLIDRSRVTPESRTHFFNLAALAMRQVLADHARRRRAAKRGGDGWERIDLGEIYAGDTTVAIDAVDLDDALSELSQLDDRQSQIVQMRFLAGMSVAETAQAIGMSTRTVELDWKMAKAWLRQRLGDQEAT